MNTTKRFSISELSKPLNLTDPLRDIPLNHILRYWEKEFKQIRPKKINKRRYYSQKQVEIIKKIKFLLKNKGMTISGVKKLLNTKINKLDVEDTFGLKVDFLKASLQLKSKKIFDKIKKLKNYGKKTHLKVRMVPESKPDSKFIYYAKKPTKGEKAKDKLKLKKYNPNTRKHEFFIEKKTTPA